MPAVTDFLAITKQVATDVAAAHAVAVDKEARFPRETIDALKKEKLLGAYVPKEWGGLGLSITELSAMCTTLASSCASSGMVAAMHHIQVACLVRHARDSVYLRKYLQDLCEHQWLIASVTSEVGVGGDTRSSICAVERQGERFNLTKDATTISYGAEADALLATCRRDAAAAASDQVMVLLPKGEYTLTQTTSWDTLGMRGTRSPGFKMVSSGHVDQILPDSFAEMSSATMVPFSHLLWAGVWQGIASDAIARTSSFVRAEARRKPGTVPPTALRLSELSNKLHVLRCMVRDMTSEFEKVDASADGRDRLGSMSFALRMNNTKIAASRAVAEIVLEAIQTTGILAYKNDTPFSLGRHLRDALSAALMIGNDRIHAKNAPLLLVLKDD